MNKKIILLVGVAAFALLITGASLLYKDLSNGRTPDDLLVSQATPVPAENPEATSEQAASDTEDGEEAASQAAPDFTVYDAEGNAVKLSDFAGKPVVVNFWASWCGPCRMVGPILDEIAAERSDIKVCKINVDEQPALAAQFGVMSIPTLVVVKNGQEVNRSVGAMPKARILALL